MKFLQSIFNRRTVDADLLRRLDQIERSIQIIANAHNVVDSREQALRKYFGLSYVVNKKGKAFLRKARTPKKRKYTKRALNNTNNNTNNEPG